MFWLLLYLRHFKTVPIPWEQFGHFSFFLYLEIFGWEQLKNHPVALVLILVSFYMCTQDGRQHSWNRIMCNSRRGWRCRGACREEAEVITNGEVNRVQVFNWKLIFKSFLKRSEGVEEKSFVVVAQGTAPNGSGKEARWWSNPSLYVISGVHIFT